MRCNPILYKLLLFFALMLFYKISSGQAVGKLKGEVLDAAKKEAMPGATIFEKSNRSNTVIADIKGNYELNLPVGNHTLVCTFIGMVADTFTVNIESGKTQLHNVLLIDSKREMGTVVISAGKYEQQLSEVTVSMQLLQPQLIESKNTVNIKSALEQSPGLTILDEEPQMRGGSGFSFGVGSRVATLIDGLPILTGDAGRTDWGFIPTENIEQVEIIEGASSVLYGSSALSGTINFRTKYPKDSKSTYIRTYTGFYSTPSNAAAKWWDGAANYSGLNFSHSQKIKQSDLIIGGQLNYDHNFIGPYILDGSTPIKADTLSNNDVANRSGRINFNYRYRSIKTQGLSMGINGNIMLTHSNFSLVWGNDSDRIYRAYPGTMSITNQTAFYVDPFITYYSPTGFKHHIHARLYYTDNNINNGQSNSAQVYLAEYQFNKVFAMLDGLNITGGIYTNQTFSHATLYAGSGSPDNSLHNWSVYSQLDKKFFNVLNVSAGVRGEYFKMNTNQSVIKPIFRAGFNLKLTKNTNFRCSYGQGYRYPTLAEKYIITTTGGIYVFPNPTIQPESSWCTEAGVKQSFHIGKLTGYADLVAFTQQYHNTIEYIYAIWAPDSAGFKFVNTGSTHVNGYEFSVMGNGNIAHNLSCNLLLGYTYTLPQTQNPNYVFATDNPDLGSGFTPTQLTYANTSTDTTNNILKYRFQHLFKVDVSFTYKKLSAGVSMRYYSYMQNIDKTFYDLDHPAGLQTGITNYRKIHDNGSTVFDVRISYRVGNHFNVAVISNNVANLEYTLRPLKIEAPRTLALQISATF